MSGYELCDRYALELPDLLLGTIRSALEQSADTAGTEALQAETAQVRAAVPEQARDSFDTLLTDARATYHLRDERGLYCDLWAYGITRRTVLEAGQRLAAAGRIAEPQHLTEAGYSEMQALIGDGTGPSAQELAKRETVRTTLSPDIAPPFLGPRPLGPPPPEWLPPSMQRVMGAMGTVAGLGMGIPRARKGEPAERSVRGTPANGGVYEGTARIVLGPVDFSRIQQGDVIIARTTSQAFNVVLPLVGAIVSERGGVLSHPAITAREYGIPALVACGQATTKVPDGARVRVNGDAGELTVLG